MNPTHLRSLVRKYNGAGILVAGCCLCWHYLWTKRRSALLLPLAVISLVGLIFGYRRPPASFYSKAIQRQASSLYLMDALNKRDTRAALAALQAGADPNYREQRRGGETPIIAAARTGNLIITKSLIARGANIDAAETDLGGTALHAAIWSSPEVTKALLDAGANPDASYMGGLTALMRVAECDDERLTRFNLLLQHNADINARDEYGVSVLMHVAGAPGDKVDMTRRLMSLGVDFRATDHDGKTALDHALHKDRRERHNDLCIEALSQAGAKRAIGH